MQQRSTVRRGNATYCDPSLMLTLFCWLLAVYCKNCVCCSFGKNRFNWTSHRYVPLQDVLPQCDHRLAQHLSGGEDEIPGREVGVQQSHCLHESVRGWQVPYLHRTLQTQTTTHTQALIIFVSITHYNVPLKKKSMCTQALCIPSKQSVYAHFVPKAHTYLSTIASKRLIANEEGLTRCTVSQRVASCHDSTLMIGCTVFTPPSLPPFTPPLPPTPSPGTLLLRWVQLNLVRTWVSAWPTVFWYQSKLTVSDLSRVVLLPLTYSKYVHHPMQRKLWGRAQQ